MSNTSLFSLEAAVGSRGRVNAWPLARVQFDREPVTDMESLIGRYRIREFQSPFRSTVPLLAIVRNSPSIVDQVLRDFGFSERATFHFEFRVKPPQGRGEASHTDLMVRQGDAQLGIEAKWTEPTYPTVSEWLQPNGAESANRRQVLAGWLNLIQPFASRSVAAEEVADVTYQTLHRAASACAGVERPQLAYLQFGVDSEQIELCREARLLDLGRLRDALGRPDQFPFRLIEIEIEPTSAFDGLRRLGKGEPKTGEAVRAALMSRSLFTVKSVSVHSLP